ncbi:hypothetical protein ACFSS8_06780 [Paracoccus kondratievae]
MQVAFAGDRRFGRGLWAGKVPGQYIPRAEIQRDRHHYRLIRPQRDDEACVARQRTRAQFGQETQPVARLLNIRRNQIKIGSPPRGGLGQGALAFADRDGEIDPVLQGIAPSHCRAWLVGDKHCARVAVVQEWRRFLGQAGNRFLGRCAFMPHQSANAGQQGQIVPTGVNQSCCAGAQSLDPLAATCLNEDWPLGAAGQRPQSRAKCGAFHIAQAASDQDDIRMDLPGELQRLDPIVAVVTS